MRRTLLLSFGLFSLLLCPSFAREIIIKEGDTLSGIAKKYNLSIRSLMEKNQIFNSDNLQIGQKINLPEKISLEQYNNYYIVQKGDTLVNIANKYNINKKLILEINNFDNPNILYVGQKVNIPEGATNRIINNSISSHVVRKGETLTMISKKYNVSIENIISINNIEDPSFIKPGSTLIIRTNQKVTSSLLGTSKKSTTVLASNASKILIAESDTVPDWRKYGSLKINWANWKEMNGSYVTPAINLNGKPLFLAVNCSTTRMNNTGKNSQWGKWFAPETEFEFNLVDDVCKANS